MKNWITTAVAIIAVVVSVCALCLDYKHAEDALQSQQASDARHDEQFATAMSKAGEANELAGKANELAGEANEFAGEAHELAGKANELAGEANELAGEANDAAEKHYQELNQQFEESMRVTDEALKAQLEHYNELKKQYEDLVKPHTKFDEIRDRLARLDDKIERAEQKISDFIGLGQDISEHQNNLSEAKELRNQAESAWDKASYDEADESISEAHILLDKIPSPTIPPGITYVSAKIINEDGVFTESVTAESEGGEVRLTIDEGTAAKTKEGEPLNEISIIEAIEPPSDNDIIGLTYNIGPDGATFEPPITITFTYDSAGVPEGVDEEDLVIASWDEDAGEWVVLEDITVERVTNTISAPVSHFTYFTVMAFIPPAAPPVEVAPTPEITVTVPPAPSVTLPAPEIIIPAPEIVLPAPQITLPPSPAPVAPIPSWALYVIIIIIGAVTLIVVGVVVWFIAFRRKA